MDNFNCDKCGPVADKCTVIDDPMSIEATLADREARYGAFPLTASIVQGIQHAFKCAPKWDGLDDTMKHALEMIALKIGRILNGYPGYPDNWHDIAGYATLVEKDLAQVDGEIEELGK